MSVRDELSLVAPRLRRYARALTHAAPAPNDAADDLVQTTVIRVLDANLGEPKADVALQAFALLTQLNRERQALQVARDTASPGNVHDDDGLARAGQPHLLPQGLTAALQGLRLDEREALLLVALEGFSYAQAARILHVSRGSLVARLGRARTHLGEALADAPTPLTPRRFAHLRLVK